VVRTVYQHFGLPLNGVERAVRGWLDDPGNRSDRFGKWTYDLADYQVTEDEVRERLAGYRERFGCDAARPSSRIWPGASLDGWFVR
jgi:hypothetical protein